jgi:hypothetical protein
MSIGSEIMERVGDKVSTIRVDKANTLHGEDAISVHVGLINGKTVDGIFTTQPRANFGGVEFSGPKDVVGLMVAKIESVLRGTAE